MDRLRNRGGLRLAPPVPLSQVHRFKKAKMDFVDLMDRNLFPHGEAMSKPTKTTPQKKRKLARVVIGGGTGSTQRPMYPLTARFASRISKAFSRTMNPVPSAARVRHANCLTLPECLTLRPKMAPGLDVRRFSCLTLMPYYSPVNRGLIERVRQLDKNETEQYRRGIRGSRGG